MRSWQSCSQLSSSSLFLHVAFSLPAAAPAGTYTLSLHDALPILAQACLVDELLSGNAVPAFVKSGYTFGMAPGAAVGPPLVTYNATATPISVGSSGQNMFCSDQSGVVRHDITGAACNNASPAVQ